MNFFFDKRKWMSFGSQIINELKNRNHAVVRSRNHKIIHFYKRQENCNFHWLLSEWCLCNDVRFGNGLKFKNARRFVGENKSFRILEFTWWNLKLVSETKREQFASTVYKKTNLPTKLETHWFFTHAQPWTCITRGGEQKNTFQDP